MSKENFLNCDINDREKLFTFLYKSCFLPVSRYISKKGGSFEEAKDIFQDALLIYYEKAITGTIELRSNDKAYLIGICRHIWLRKYNAEARYVPLNDFDAEMEEDVNPSDQKILRFLEIAGKKCMELLKSFYYDKISLSDAAELFGFSGVRSATVQKYKCLEKVRENIKEKSLTYEDFLD